jgi:hypothetical protein
MRPVGAHLEPGEILVVPSADPGWTSLVMTASAVLRNWARILTDDARPKDRREDEEWAPRVYGSC